MKRIVILSFIVMLIFPFLYSQEEDQKFKSFSLEEAINEALKKNLDLRIELTNPEIYAAMLRKNQAIYIPNFSSDFQKSSRKFLSTNIFEGGKVAAILSDTVNATISQTIPLGGTFSASMDFSKSDTTSTTSTFNPSYRSNLSFNFSQPLLKNFGTFMTNKTIHSSRNTHQKSLLTLKQRVIDLIYQVEDAYWNLVKAYENYDVQKKSLQLAKDALRQRELEVKIGVSAQMDILTAQAEAASRESSTLQAWKEIQTAEESLKKILNISQTEESIKPTDKPNFEATSEYKLDTLLAEAMEKRPDIQQVKIDLKNLNIEVRSAKNQLLPDLQLQASYYTSGLSGTRLQPDFTGQTDPVVVSKTDWDQAIKDAFKQLYKNYSIQLSLSLPIVNTSAKSDLVQARLNLKQGLLSLDNTSNTIYSEVKQAILELQSQIKIVEANRVARELAEQKLIAEQKKLSVGLSTDYLVFQYQRDLATAQSLETDALISYNLALANLDKVLGKTLEKHNYNIEGLTSK